MRHLDEIRLAHICDTGARGFLRRSIFKSRDDTVHAWRIVLCAVTQARKKEVVAVLECLRSKHSVGWRRNRVVLIREHQRGDSANYRLLLGRGRILYMPQLAGVILHLQIVMQCWLDLWRDP